MRSAIREFFIPALLVFLVTVAPGFAQNGAPPLRWVGAGHYDISGLDVSSNGSVLFTCSSIDETIKLWNTSDGSFIKTLTTPVGGLNDVAVSPDDSKLVSGGEVVFGSNISAVLVWNVASGNVTTQLAPANNLVFCVAWAPNGNLVAAGDQANAIRLWNPVSGQLVQTLQAPGFGGVFDLAFSPDGSKIVAGYADNLVRIWNVSTGAVLNTLTGHTFFVDSVAYSPDGARVASGSWDNTIRTWNATTGALEHTITGHSDIVRSLAFSPDSTKLVSGSWDHSIRVWNATTGVLINNFGTPDPGSVNAVRYSPNGLQLLSGGIGSGGSVRDASNGTELAHVGHHLANIRAVTINVTQTILVSGAGDTDCRVWDLATGADLVTFPNHDDVINAIDLTADGSTAASASGSPPPDTIDPSVRIWNTATGQQIHLLPGHQFGTTGVDFTLDELTVISGGRDALVKRWSVATGALLTSFGSTVGVITHMGLSPDGTKLAVAGNALKTLDPATGAVLQTFAIPGSNTVEALGWSADSQQLLVGVGIYGNNLHLFNATTGVLVRTFSGDPDGFIQGVALSPDGHTATCGSGYSRKIRTFFVDDGTPLKVWDKETGWGIFPSLPVFYAANGGLAYGRADATVVMSDCPGQLTSYGSGCGGSGAIVPSLGILGCATAGGALTVVVTQGLGGAPAFFVLGTGQASIPILGCTLLVDPLVQPVPFLALNLSGTGAGGGSLILPVIVPPWFPPQTLALQVWIQDAGGPQGFANTNGVSLVFE